MTELKDKVVWITGASSGIGEALADPASDKATRHEAEALGIEIAQVDNVVGHPVKVARNQGFCRLAHVPPGACATTGESR